jgi:hypothetical protein
MKHDRLQRNFDELNELNLSSTRRYNASRKYNQTLPDMNDLNRVKNQIKNLYTEELYVGKAIRNELKIQLFEIRNLYRTVSSAIIDSRATLSQNFENEQTQILNKWNKLRSLLTFTGNQSV